MAKRPEDAKPLAFCPLCRSEQLLGNFRRLRDEPPLYMDFCKACEALYGSIEPYQDKKIGAILSDEAYKFLKSGERPSEPVASEMVRLREESEKELGRRELMRRRLIYYVTQFDPNYKAGWVHHDICRRLEKFIEDVAAKKSPRLMLWVPPRHGKSRLVSQELPSWMLGHHPDWEFISASYAMTLPVGFSRMIRDRLDDPAYQTIFPRTRLRPDSRGIEEWFTTKGGRFKAVGVEGGITGTGCHILSIDDPVKDYQEAIGAANESTYNWYTGVARTRMAPGGGILITQTRWVDNDLSGRLLMDREALRAAGVSEDELDNWEIVRYPALAEEDEYLFPNGKIMIGPPEIPDGARLLRRKEEALHPERYDTKSLRILRNTMPPLQWSALYQQNPVPPEGEFFTNDMFRFFAQLPGTHEEYSFFSAWDLAIGEKTQNDWTVGTVGALHYTNALYVVDMIRARMNTFAIVESIVGLATKWPLLQVVGIEDGQIKKTMAPLLEQAITEHKVGFSLDEELKPVTDKLLRARPLQQRMQMGQLYLPTGQPWALTIQQELTRFPNGTHDDIVDSLAWLARMALRIAPPLPRAYKQRKGLVSWRKQLSKHTANSGPRKFMTA